MPPEPSPEDVRELLGAYALNALDPEERARVDALVLADAAARAELHELEHAAAWLGHASLRPPARAWDAIAAEMESDLDDGARPPTVTPAAAPTPIRPGRGSRWLVAAVVALVALGAAAGVVALTDRAEKRSDTVAEEAQQARRDGARTVTLRSDDGRWSAPVVVADRAGYLRDSSMPPAPRGRDLQLWSITPAGPVSAGVIHGPGDWHRFELAKATTALAVTVEPAGGSRAPTGAPIVSGEIRA